DLAEDAFFNYLKDLEMLARLEIVSMYCDEQPDPSDNVLHIIGRTHNTPYKYFYRTYAHQMWTPWVPVTINIDGDLLVAAVWKQRLHLFWVTFKEQVRQEGVGGSGKFYQDMGNSDRVAPPPRQVDVQLSWSEYFQGKWASPQSSGFGNLTDLNDELDPQAVFIYVTKETVTDAAGNVEDGAIDIYLNDPIHKVFRVVNKNSPPQASDSYANASPPVYDPDRLGIDATMYTSSRGLDVKYTQRMQISGTSPVDIRKAILQQGANLTDNANYALLVSSNPPQQTSVDSSETGFGWFDSPSLVEGLTRPFFYQDNANTFFVEPTMTETTIDEWDWWVIQYPRSYSHLNTNDWWSNLNLQASVPVARHLPPISQIDPTSLYQLKPTRDWATNPATVLRYGGNFVGAGGGLTLVTQPGQNGPANSGVQLKPVAPGGSQGLNGNGQVLNGGNLSAILQASGMNLVNQSGLTRGTLANVQVEQHYNGNGFVA